MISHVIKRDGKKVRFQPDKINKLASWATTHGLSWSPIALNGLKKLTDGCSVQDIMKALIKACIDERTSAHLAVAGKIYVADLYKRVYADNNSVPYTLKQQLDKMCRLGYYQKFNYTDEELSLIDTWLKHEDDYKLLYTQINQMESKYLVCNRATNTTYETPRFMYARIALAIFQHSENRMYHIQKYLEYLQDLTLSLPSPNWSYIGTVKKTGASCCLYIVEDTDDSIATGEHITHKMTTAGAGLGLNLHVRTSQDPALNGTILHMGKLPYLRVHQYTTSSNKQGCYDKYTDVLTDKGYIPFSEVTKNTLIAQVRDDLSVEFVKPTRIVAYKHTGDMYRFSFKGNHYLDVNVTPDHRMLFKTTKKLSKKVSSGFESVTQTQQVSKVFSESRADSFEPSRLTTMFNAGNYKLGFVDFTSLDQLQVAYQADGYVNIFDSTLKFSFKKARKIARLTSIVEELNYPYSIKPRLDGSVVFSVKVPEKYLHLFTKDFSQVEIAHCSHSFLKSFVSEVRHWDGYSLDSDVDAFGFSNTNEAAVDKVQACASLVGAYTKKTDITEREGGRLDIYSLTISFFKNNITSSSIKKTVSFYDDMVYCVEVPSNKIIVRRNGLTLICGNSRGGALNCFTSQNDPEIAKHIKARNPTTVVENKVDGIDFAILYNPFFMEKARAKGSLDWMLISLYHAPDLYKAFYSDNLDLYKELYNKYDADETVPKTYVKARELLVLLASEEYETGRLYDGNCYEINRHTAFLDPIYSSNLCMEITLPTKPFHHVLKLYEKYSSEYAYLTLKDTKEELEISDLDEAKKVLAEVKIGDTYNGKEVLNIQTKNEIALCNLAAINLNRDFTQEEYEDRCYYALRTVDYVILNSKYPFPNVEYTAQQRMSAGVGIMNFAYDMARKGLYYSTTAGKLHSHDVAERHMYSLIKASLRISKERGNAPWIHKTKWKDGWTPMQTYNRNVDNIAEFKYQYNWKDLSLEIKENGGIAHSALCAEMPKQLLGI